MGDVQSNLRKSALAVAVGIAVCSAAGIGWVREARQYRADPPVTDALGDIRLMANGINGTPPEVYFALGKPYEKTAFDLSQGKRLYSWFGCAECHATGEGGKGPSFIDGWWYYGPSMESIFASIRDGRPHGMPAFGEKMTTDQIWQLAGYIKTLGAYSASKSAPSRNDDKHTLPAENRAPASVLFNEGPAPLHPEQGPSP